MRHYLYAMKATNPDPVNSGDMKSWFDYYKVKSGETFVPTKNPDALKLVKGDTIWFVMDGEVLGLATITKDVTEVPPSDGDGRYEIWYDSDVIQSFKTFNVNFDEGLLPDGVDLSLLADTLKNLLK